MGRSRNHRAGGRDLRAGVGRMAVVPRDCTPGKRLIDLDEDQQDAVFAVSHYLDNLGALVVHDLLTPDAARTFLGSSAIQMWTILAPYIYTERESRGFRIYQIHFEYLASLMAKVDIEAELLEKYGGSMPPAGWKSDWPARLSGAPRGR
jgi:hypothetical protein